MKVEEEHSQRLEILNQNSNSALLGVDPLIDGVFSLPWSSPIEKATNIVQENGIKEVKRARRMKNSWEKKFDPKACTISN